MAVAGASRYSDNSAQVTKALDNALSPKTIHEHMTGKGGGKGGGKDGYCDGVILAIRLEAMSGVGPNNQPYQEYSDSYQAQIDKAGKSAAMGKSFLRGIGKTGAQAGMLSRNRFSTKVDGQGDLYIVWTSDGSKEMDIYARVHQGLIPGRGKTPVRKWMHLQTVAAANAVVQAYKLAVEDITALFNAKRMRT